MAHARCSGFPNRRMRTTNGRTSLLFRYGENSGDLAHFSSHRFRNLKPANYGASSWFEGRKELHPDCAYSRTPMLIPFLVGLFNRSFQPHLDQMHNGSVDDPSSHRL